MNTDLVTDAGAGAGAAHLGRRATSPTEPTQLGAAQWLVNRAAELLEHRPVQSDGALDEVLDGLAAAAADAGLRTRREQPLLAGGTAELLIGYADHGGASGQVAVVVAEHGATDALRGRLRRLGSHREVAAVLVATTRPRHRTLAEEVTAVPVRVVVIGHCRHEPSIPPSLEGSVRTSRVPQRAG